MQRREFLVVSSMGAVASATAWAAPNVLSSPNDVDVIVYDSRYPVARDIAQRQVEQGARAFESEACMVSLWRGPLAEVIERGETRIAGFTTYSDFTLARECARERGLRVLEERWCRECPGSFVSWRIGV